MAGTALIVGCGRDYLTSLAIAGDEGAASQIRGRGGGNSVLLQVAAEAGPFDHVYAITNSDAEYHWRGVDIFRKTHLITTAEAELPCGGETGREWLEIEKEGGPFKFIAFPAVLGYLADYVSEDAPAAALETTARICAPGGTIAAIDRGGDWREGRFRRFWEAGDFPGLYASLAPPSLKLEACLGAEYGFSFALYRKVG